MPGLAQAPGGLGPLQASPPLATCLEKRIQPLCPAALPAQGPGAVCFLNRVNQTSEQQTQCQ